MKSVFSGISKHLFLLVVMLLALGLSGCMQRQPCQKANMTIAASDIPDDMLKQNKRLSKFKENMSVSEITLGNANTSLGTFQIDTSQVNAALTQSLINLGLYNSDNTKARYKINANSFKIEQPLAGVDMEATCQINYQVIDTIQNKILYEKTLSTRHTTKFSEAFVGVKRLKLANEAAVKANIRVFITELVNL